MDIELHFNFSARDWVLRLDRSTCPSSRTTGRVKILVGLDSNGQFIVGVQSDDPSHQKPLSEQGLGRPMPQNKDTDAFSCI